MNFIESLPLPERLFFSYLLIGCLNFWEGRIAPKELDGSGSKDQIQEFGFDVTLVSTLRELLDLGCHFLLLLKFLSVKEFLNALVHSLFYWHGYISAFTFA